MQIEPLEKMLIDDSYKGYPNGVEPTRLGAIGTRGWSLLRQDISLPAAVLLDSAVDNNSLWMRRFLSVTGARICPHGKTTMSPQLFERQLQDGAWGITLATVDQIRIARAYDVKRILMANQLVERQGIRYVLDELAADPEFDFYCLADSPASVSLLAEAAKARGLTRPVQLLLEAGLHGGRTGCRTETQARATVQAVREAAPHLVLRGVEGFEGLIKGSSAEEKQAKVEAFLEYMVQLLKAGLAENWFAEGPVLLTAGGSAFFDLAAERFANAARGRDITVVLRSGCYLTHDSKSYEHMFDDILARSASARETGGRLRAALQVWAVVQSTPEPGLALATMGRRDVGSDVDMPTPLLWYRAGMNRPAPLPEGHLVTGLNDQHAYIQLPPDSPLRFGDLVGFGISHPCTTFDRWQLIYRVNDDYDITGAIRTFF